MKNQINKIPYGIDKWLGEEDISKAGESFIFDTISLISRGDALVECGIFNDDQNPLFLSAIIEMLIVTRSLLQRQKELNALSPEQLNILEHIKYFRDGLCHSESWRSKGNKVKYRITYCRENYDGSSPWFNNLSNNSILSKELYLKADDISLFIGDRRLWINKELILTFQLTCSYFSQRLPDDYAFSVKCRQFCDL